MLSLKKINEELKKKPYDAILFSDEARFGTRTKIGHGWFKKGVRTLGKVNIGYKAFYVYTAIDAKTGSNFSTGFPHVDTATMNIFLQEFSKIYEGLTIALIIDGAGWHKSDDLEIPENIDIFNCHHTR
ncbi:hypothetical protein FACS1894122_06590 [Alphaproteobacteria bacterium]|nr:hypothetical protein FACS1894122_06590 [Alphaproteobacteria bacterium]